MNFLNNVTIGKRILVSIGLLLILLVSQGYFSIRSLDSVNQKSTEIETAWLPRAILFGNLVSYTSDYRTHKLFHNLTKDSNTQKVLEEQMSADLQQIKDEEIRFEKTIKSEEERQLFNTFKNNWDEYVHVTETEFLPLSRANKKDEAENSVLAAAPLFEKAIGSLNDGIKLNEKGGIAASQAADKEFANAQRTIFGILGGALILGLIAGLYMRSGANQVIKIVKDSIDQLTSLSQSLSASTQQASSAAGQNASIAQQVAAGATQQSKQAEEISKALAQMSAAVNQMSTSGKEVTENATSASKLAQETGEATEKINKIVDVITQTAEQTNLLALNAAIEAARAGEAGRGFAVVADEVRKLADSSSKAAEEVKIVVKEISTRITETVRSIGQVTVRIQDVSAGVNQQSATVTQVAKTMDSIAAVAEQSASGAQQLSASTLQTSSASQQVAASSMRLQDLISQLQKLVGGSVPEKNKQSLRSDDLKQSLGSEDLSQSDSAKKPVEVKKMEQPVPSDNVVPKPINLAENTRDHIIKAEEHLAKMREDFKSRDAIAQSPEIPESGFPVVETPANGESKSWIPSQ